MIEIIFRTVVAWTGLVVLLIAGDMIQQSLFGQDASLTSGFVVVTTLLLLSIGYAGLKTRFPDRVRAVEGVPTVPIRNGVQDRRQMRAARVTMDDVLEAVRDNNLTEPDQVRFAVLETDGIISIIPYPSSRQ